MSRWKTSFPKSKIYSLIGAALSLILGNSPFFLPFITFIGFWLWFYTIEGSRRAFFVSFLIGLPYWFYHSFWIYNLDVPEKLKVLLLLGVVSMSLVLAVIWGIWGYLTSKFKGFYMVIFGSLFWVSLEFIRGECLYDLSYPWALIGESFVKSPFLKLASIGGIYLLSFLAVFVGGLLFLRKYRLVAVVLALSLVWNIIYKPPESYGRIKVAILQPNIMPRFAFDPKEWDETFKAYHEIIRDIKDVDLIVSSESAFPGVHSFSQNSKRLVYEITSITNSPLLFGTAGVEKTQKGYKFFNRALLVDRDTNIVGYYDKVRLVPFGENLPFYEFLPEFIRNIDIGQGNYERGRGFYPINFGNIKLGVMICYESIFSGIGKELVSRGADVLIVMTSDGWFGRSIGPVEHFYLGVFRAVETGRTMVRSAKTGISAIISPDGRILESLPLYTRGSIVSYVDIYKHKTPYVKFGFLFPYICVILSIALWMLRKKFIGYS